MKEYTALNNRNNSNVVPSYAQLLSSTDSSWLFALMFACCFGCGRGCRIVYTIHNQQDNVGNQQDYNQGQKQLKVT